MTDTFESDVRIRSRPAGVASALTLVVFTFVSGQLRAASSGGERGAGPVVERADALAESIASADSAPEALSQFQVLRRLGAYLPHVRHRALLRKTASKAESPLVEFRAVRARTREAINAGESSVGPRGMEGPLGEQGCLMHWSVVGPFDNNSMQAFERRLPPESGTGGPYDGKEIEVDWRTLPASFADTCAFRLGRTLEPTGSSVAYLASTVTVDQPRSAQLLVGADGAYRVWVNGHPVAQQRPDLGLSPDNQAWPVSLNRGENRILVKLASKTGGALGWIARLVDGDLEPIDLDAAAAVPGEEVDAFDDGASVETTGRGLLERARSCADRDGVRAARCAVLWRQLESEPAAEPWRSVAERLADPVLNSGAGDEPVTDLPGRVLARLAPLFAEHTKRLEILEAARSLAPDDPWLALRQARALGQSAQGLRRSEQRRVVEELAARRPDFWPAALRLSDWYAQQGYHGRALEHLRDAPVENAQQRPGVVRRLANLHETAGSRQRARELYARHAEIAALDSSWPWRRVDDLLAAGDAERALEVVRSQRRLEPASTQWGLKAIAILRSLGRAPEALGTIDALIDDKPGEVRLRRKKAELLVSLDRREEAVEPVEVAGRLEPQNRQLREYRDHLKPGGEGYHTPWMVEDVRGLADEHAPSPQARELLVDQTIVNVQPNGLYREVVQRVERVNRSQGVDGANSHSVSFQAGDEQVDVIDVRIHKSDGTVLEDYDSWRSESSGGGKYYTDQAYLNMRANNVETGDLVEYRYRVRQIANENFRGDYFGDVAYLQGSEPIALERYVVRHPSTMDVSFREPSLEHDTISDALPGGASPEEGFQVRGFELSEVPAVKTDPRQPGHTDVYDYVMVSNKASWDAVGEWWWNLVEEQLILDDQIRKKTEELIAGLESDREKMAAIQNWVVRNTRYLHVGLGIHGWKPYQTTQCYRNKFGDCKDKSSLMKVMLDHAGIETNLVLVRTRDRGAIDESPANMHVFNHAINYVPQFDRFLDPTAEFNGTGELPPMDQDGQALIVEEGGDTRFTRIPVDDAEDNRIERTLEVDLTRQPTVTTGTFVAHGEKAVHYRRSLDDPERRDEKFEKQLASVYPGATLVSATYRHLDDLEEPVEIEFTFEGGRIRRGGEGETYLFPYGVPKDLQSRFAGQTERNQDLVLRVPFRNQTTVDYELPADATVTRIPESSDVDSEFGRASVEYEREGSRLSVDVSFQFDQYRVPVERYADFRTFVSRATDALTETIEIEPT